MITIYKLTMRQGAVKHIEFFDALDEAHNERDYASALTFRGEKVYDEVHVTHASMTTARDVLDWYDREVKLT